MLKALNSIFRMSKRPGSPQLAAEIPKPLPKKQKQKTKKYKPAKIDPTSSEGVLRRNINDAFPDAPLNDMTAFMNRDRTQEWHMHGASPNLQIVSLSSNGLGLGFDQERQRVVCVPFAVPGDTVNVHIYRTEEYYLEAEIREIVKPSGLREEGAKPFCKYFGKCGGCQYQELSYESQLEIKRQVVANAYRYFAPNLKLPEIHKTVPSPLQKGYRTKLTPHFDVPKKGLQGPDDFPIGFGQKGRKEVLDIEDCPIGTGVVNDGMKSERARMRANWANYKRGVTLLLREGENNSLVTDPKQTIREKVGDNLFEYKAGEFFQNNNSILPVVTEFVSSQLQIDGKEPEYLVDTYCGCGLFAIACSGNAKRVIGVEISAQNVEFARTNAKLNNIENAEFVTGQAERIFEKVNDSPATTSVVIDPPRKGCDKLFLDQLLEFGPAKIVYVSCNVHSQARDIEYFVEQAKGKYVVESLGGFDFFPQTYHVEGVAVLKRVGN